MDRLTVAVVGGVVALVVVGLAVAGFSRGREVPPDLGTPSGVVLAYALAEGRGDGQTAWDLLAPSAQARGDRDRFLARVGSGQSNAYFSTQDEQVDGDSASVTLLTTYPGSGGLFGGGSSNTRTTVRLARQPDGWRITVPPDGYALLSQKP
jgi:hypothetical protein